MASITAACRLSTRFAKGQLRSHVCSRGLQTSSMRQAAQNFTMPAMSPTMTEGNIAKWNVKEGDSYSTGDVLLEIETDKANMDVEAQDDGILAKIIQSDGAKGVKVGTRIAVIAEPGDDLSSLEIPPDNSAPTPPPPKEETSSGPPPPPASESSAESTAKHTPSSSSSSTPSGPGQNPAYPLYPSVIQLLHENHIAESDIPKIPASGPQGRLLKGDVLSYLGTIDSSYSSKQSARIASMAHLDLSNIKIAAPAPKAPPKAEVGLSLEEALESFTEVSVPISLAQVLATQKRIQDTLGVTMPLSTFIARATDIANDDLPLSKDRKLTSDELFNSIIGFDQAEPTTSRGSFIPQIAAISPVTPIPPTRRRQADIIDILSGKRMTLAPIIPAAPTVGSAGAVNAFSVIVPKGGEEKRAKVFLERVKTILQVEPGRLVL